MIENFHFIRPYWFLALIPALLAIIFLLKQKSYSQGWSKFCDQELLEFLSVSSGFKQKKYPLFMLALAWFIAVFALAGPSWQKIETPLFSSKDSLVIILDLSQSMNAQDIKPSRIARARHKLTDILSMRSEGQTALIVYAGDSHVVSPLTADSNTILSMVPILNGSLMPVPGSNLIQAINHATQLFENAGEPRGRILLLTDGINTVNLNEIKNQIKKAAKSGYNTSIIGIGTQDGAPVPASQQGGYLKDRQGNIYISRLQTEQLTQLAEIGGGQYQTISVSDKDIKTLLKKPQQNQYDQVLENNEELFKHDKWQDEGVYLVLLLIPFALLAFRRGWLLLIAIVIVPFPNPSYAFSWDDLWLRADQQGARSFQQGKHEQAAGQFNSPDWQGSAYYRSGQYEKALQAFNNSDSLDALYNKANTLAQLSRFKEAIENYNKVLEQDPQHADSLKNKSILEKILEQQQQQQQQQNNNEQQNQQGDQKQQQQEQQQNAEQEQQQNSEQQSAQQQKQESEQQQSSQDQQQESEQQSQQQAQEQQQNQEQEAQAEDKYTEQLSTSEQEKQLNDQDEQEQSETPTETQFSKLSEEEQQSMQQYLQQIPDDPSYLLRRKFYLNSRRNPQQQQDTNPW